MLFFVTEGRHVTQKGIGGMKEPSLHRLAHLSVRISRETVAE